MPDGLHCRVCGADFPNAAASKSKSCIDRGSEPMLNVKNEKPVQSHVLEVKKPLAG